MITSVSELGVVLKPDFSNLSKETLKNYIPELFEVAIKGNIIELHTPKYLVTITYQDEAYYATIDSRATLDVLKRDSSLNLNPTLVKTGVPGINGLKQLLDQLGSALTVLIADEG